MDLIRLEVGGFVQAESSELERQEEKFDQSMRQMYVVIIAICLLALLFAVAFAYLTFRETQHRLKIQLHKETQSLLGIQEEANRQLQVTNTNLHIMEERLAVTLDSIDDAVIATDAEGRVTLLNPLAERLTGWTRAEAYDRPIEDVFHIIHADTREAYPVPVRETLAQGTTLSLANHTIALARDGTECHIADSCAPILDRTGAVVGAVLVFRDVTERRRLDQILHEKTIELERSTAIAEKANQAKSDFLSSMSHELRTPLSAILGFAQLIESGVPPPTPAQKRGLDQILKAGWYLLTLINEILDLALIESGKLSLSMEPLPLNDILHECHTMIEPQAQQRNIRMTFPEFTARPVIYVNGDRTRVKQVLINLLSNAIKYNAPGGRVTVECKIIDHNRVRISVGDSGAGLARDQIAQLFQPFNRLGQESGAEEGTGIGLVMSKKLMELMGGAIGVESTPGQGSQFWIELNPSIPPQIIMDLAAEGATENADVPGTRVYTLLYVEDNPANLLLVEDIVSRRPDIHLLSARDGMTGVKMAFNAKPDVILMDINLPGISGIQALRILMDSPATMHIPVIALSANAMQRDIEKGLEAGFFRYLTKPIRLNEFMETLDIAFKLVDTPTAHAGQEVER